MKQPKIHPVVFYTVIILYLAVLGFVRDYVFVNVNFQAAKLFYHDDFEYQLPAAMKWLEHFSYPQLYYGKFLLTFTCMLLYLLPAILVVKRMFPGRTYLRWTLGAHAAVFLFSIFVFAFGLAFNLYDKCYSIARFFSGWLESPMMLMLLLVAFRISQIEKDKLHT